MNIPLVDLKIQYEKIKYEVNETVLKVLSSGKYIMGDNVEKLEMEFANYIGTKYAIAVANGTDALTISLRSLGIKEGDEVITTPLSFFATSESIAAIGAVPVFIDIDKDYYTIDVEKIESKITSKTKAIIPVHIYGQMCEMTSLMSLAKKYNLKVIEDACQAIGAEYNAKKAGSIGDTGCFSFFPTKNLGCYGDGGVITTNDENVMKMAKTLRVHGAGQYAKDAFTYIEGDSLSTDENSNADSKYYNYFVGYNSRLDEIQAAILRVKLKYIDTWNERRREIARFYNNSLVNKNLKTPLENSMGTHVYHIYPIISQQRDKIINNLKEKGIGVGIHFPVPLHLQSALKYLNYKKGDLPIAEEFCNSVFDIPVYPELEKQQIEYIIDTLIDCHSKI